ncbi:MAG: hypothetical protein IKN63_03585 [Bacilli bacterium]|nr:hypothetical protein [Bacilli bacterium]
MSIENQFYLNNNPLLKKYLHENPKYYKALNREPEFILELNELMKEKYKLTLPDKIDKIKERLEMLNTFIDILN